MPDYVSGLETDLNKLVTAVWILETPDDHPNGSQGTAFFVAQYGLVTCAHVYREGILAFNSDNPDKKYPVCAKAIDVDRDVAILDIDYDSPFKFQAAISTPDIWDPIILLGFPKYQPGKQSLRARGEINDSFTRSGRPRIQIDAQIVAGNSGGPVLNQNYEVIGIAANGRDYHQEHADELFGVIPISELNNVLVEKALGAHVGEQKVAQP